MQTIDTLVEEYEDSYTMLLMCLKKVATQHQSLKDAAKIELGLKTFLEDGNFKGFTDTFEDLHGMIQLPGIAAQRLMACRLWFCWRRRLENSCTCSCNESNGQD